MADKQTPANEMQSNMQEMANGAKDINTASKVAVKAASGNYAGAVKEIVKNPTGFLKGALAIFLAILIPIALILSVLTNGLYNFFFGDNVYSPVSNFVQMQSDFRKNCLSESYSYLKNEIYLDIISKVKKQKISNENLKDGLDEIFANEKTLEEYISKACINLSNPTRVGKKYEDYANIINGDERYFAILEGERNGNETVYDRVSTAGQTNWNRQLQIIDFNNDGLYSEDEIKKTEKAMYTIKYKNSKFYDASESVSMYKSLFDSFFDATLTYANTKRLQQTSLLVTDEADSNYSKSLASLQKLMNNFRATEAYKDYNYSDDTDENDGMPASTAGVEINAMIAKADELIDIYTGKGTEYQDYYVNYPCQEYRDEMILTMNRLDSFLKEYGASSKATFENKIDGLPSTLPNDSIVDSVSEDVGESDAFNTEDVSIDYDEDEADNLTALEEEKMKLFTEFYTEPIFYKNLFTYNVKITNNDKNGTRYSIQKREQVTQTSSEDDISKEDIIDQVIVENINVNRIIEVSVDTCSEQVLFQIYAQYFYDEFLSEDVTVEEWGELINGIRESGAEDVITQTDYLEALMLYFAGEEIDDTADDYKPVANLNLPELVDGQNLKETSFNDASLVADNGEKNNNLVIPSYVFTDEKSTDNDEIVQTSDAYFSNYLKFKSTNSTKSEDKDYYSKNKTINQTIMFNSTFSDDLKNVISQNETAKKSWTEGKTRAITAVVAVDEFELNRDINDSNCTFFATNGSENAKEILVSGVLNVTLENGTRTNINCEAVNLEYNTGKALLVFKYDSEKKIAAFNCLSVEISPENKNSAIRNATYYIGSISDSYVNMMNLGELYQVYLDAGITNSSVLTEAGYVVANIYIQYRIELFGVLFKSMEIESTKRQFVTDVSNIVKNEDGNLLIRGNSETGKALSMMTTSCANGKFFYFVSCHPDSLLYMPEGMELCQWSGELPKTHGSLSDKDGDLVSFANTSDKDLKKDRILDFYGVNEYSDEGYEAYNEALEQAQTYTATLNALGYQGAAEPVSNWISFKDNLLQYTIIGFQSSAIDKNGEYQILKSSHYQNSTWGAWRKCEYWETKSSGANAKSAYEYFKEQTKNPPANISDEEKEDYIATVATEPVILGTTTQTNVLNDNSAISTPYDYTDAYTYPTFAISVELVGATEGIYGNMTDYSDLGSNAYSLYDVFDLDEVNNDAYVDESSGYCWPLEDSYDVTTLISASFKGVVTDVNNNYTDKTTGEKTATMTVRVDEKDEETSSEVVVGNEITLRNVKPLLTEGSSFDSGQILAHNLSSYSYIDMTTEGDTSISRSNSFAYFKLTTAIAVNPEQAKEDASGKVSNVLAMFDGKIIENGNGNLILYSEEDDSSEGGLYCEYEGDNFTSCEYPIGTYVSKGSIIGTASYDSESNATNENGTQMSEDLEVAESAFKVTLYSDSNYQGSPEIKEGLIINNQESMEIIEMTDTKLICESTEKIKSNSSDDKETKYPKAKYTYENIKMLEKKNGEFTYEVGDTILAGSVVGVVPEDSFPKLTIEYRAEANLIYYKSLLEFFPGRAEFADKAKKIIVTVKDTGVDGDYVVDDVVSDSFPVYVGKSTTLSAKASPVTFNKEKFKWVEVVDEGKASLINISISNDGHTIKVTPKGDYGRTKIKGTFVDANGKLAGGQECILEVAVMKTPSKIDISYKDYYTNKDASEGERSASLRSPSNCIYNSDGTALHVFNPDKLTSNFSQENSKEKTGKYVINMFKAVLSDEFNNIKGYNGEEAIRWTLESNNGAKGLSLQEPKDSINPYTGETEKINYTGNLLYDGSSVMTNENQYYTLTATLFSQNVADDSSMTAEKKLANYSASINIHIINPIKKISAKVSAFENNSGKNSGNRLYITPSTQKTGINLNNYISWTLKSGKTNIFGPNLNNGLADMVKVDCGKYLEYKNGKITVKKEYWYNSENPDANNAWGSATTVTVTLTGIPFAYSSLGNAGLTNASFQFNIIMDFNVEKILVTNAKNASKKQTTSGIYNTTNQNKKSGYTDGGMYISYYTAFGVEGSTITVNMKAEDPDGNKITGLSPLRFDTNALDIYTLNINITEKGAEIALNSMEDINDILEEELTFTYGENAKMVIDIVYVPVAIMGHTMPSLGISDNTCFSDDHSILTPNGTININGTFNVGDKNDYNNWTYPCSFNLVTWYAHSASIKGDDVYTSSNYEFFKNFELSSVENETLSSTISKNSSTIQNGFFYSENKNYILASIDKRYFKKYFQSKITTPLTNTVKLTFIKVNGYEDYKFCYTVNVKFSYTPKYPNNFKFDNPPA